jgi:Xaa-Pro dipeptidase
MGTSERPDLGRFGLGSGAVDYEARVDFERLRQERANRALEGLEAAGLDGLLVWKDENVRFLSSLRPQIIQGKSALLNGCLLDRAGTVTLFLSGGEIDRARLTMPWIADTHPIPIMEARGLVAGAVEQTIAPVLRARGLAAGRVGVDELAFAQVEALGRALPELELADGDVVMQGARLVKSAAELALMQEAAAIGDAVTETAIAAVKPGVRELEVVGEAMRTLFRLGGEMAHLATPFVASGEHMSPPHRFASDKLIREGDLVFIDIGAMWNGYYADVGRTIVCGRPSEVQREIYTAVRHALESAREAMRPGNTNDDVAQAATAAGQERGYGDRFLSLFIGHGIGMGANEPPYVGEAMAGAETLELQAGMTLAVEPLVWVPEVRGGGGVRLARTAFDDRLLLEA